MLVSERVSPLHRYFCGFFADSIWWNFSFISQIFYVGGGFSCPSLRPAQHTSANVQRTKQLFVQQKNVRKFIHGDACILLDFPVKVLPIIGHCINALYAPLIKGTVKWKKRGGGVSGINRWAIYSSTFPQFFYCSLKDPGPLNSKKRFSAA